MRAIHIHMVVPYVYTCIESSVENIHNALLTLENGMLAMLLSSIKIQVPYSLRHSVGSVLVLRHLLADHTGC